LEANVGESEKENSKIFTDHICVTNRSVGLYTFCYSKEEEESKRKQVTRKNRIREIYKRMLRDTQFMDGTLLDLGSRLLAAGGEGIHVDFWDIYATIVYFACIYLLGQLATRVLQMPSLVGEIFCGILLGPQLADFVPNAEALVLIGEVG
jgi:hypothetical protein